MRRVIIPILAVVILIPFLVNLAGWNLYVYWNFGKKDLIVAAALGMSHNAWAEHLDDEIELGMALPDDFQISILEVGPLEIFAERRVSPMTPFTFRWIPPDEYSDYRGFAFPWLLLLSIPLLVFVGFLFVSRQKTGANQESGEGGARESRE